MQSRLEHQLNLASLAMLCHLHSFVFLAEMVCHDLHCRCRILAFIAPESLDGWDVLKSSVNPYALNPIFRLCNSHSIAFQAQKCHCLILSCSNTMMGFEMRWNPVTWDPGSTVLADDQVVHVINADGHVNRVSLDLQIHRIRVQIHCFTIGFYHQ